MHIRWAPLLALTFVALSRCATVPTDAPALPDLPHPPPVVTLPAPDPIPAPPLAPAYDVVLPPMDLEAVAPQGKRGRKAQGHLLTPRSGGHRDPDSNLLTYPYRSGAMYLVTASPRHPVTLLLPLGVRLSSPPVLLNKGDETGEWDIGYPKVGEEVSEGYQEGIILRPVRAGLEATTPLPTTTGQIFLVRLKSQERPGDLLVTWELPPGSGRPTGGKAKADQPVLVQDAPPPALNLDRLHVRYLIERGTRPVAWLPVEAYDDGSLTVLRFAEALAYTHAPQLVRLTPGHTRPLPLEYTTYRVPDQPSKGEFFIARGIHPRLRLLDGTGAYVDIIRVEDTAYDRP